MNTSDYPALYQASDKLSIGSQRVYVKLVAFDLFLMILGSVVFTYSFESVTSKAWVYYASAAVICGTVILTIVIRFAKLEAQWYNGRALAESVKTLTWRFMSCSQNFESNLPLATAQQLLINRLKELSTNFKDVGEYLDSALMMGPIVTSRMEIERLKPLAERRQFYLVKRIRNQKDWYASKARANRKWRNLWFFIILSAQILTVASAVYLIGHPESRWNFVGLFVAISSTGFAWLQLKQHQTLNQAYSTALLELSFIEASSNTVSTEVEFSKFVLDSENAISREHTLWLAQKV